ncbi:hypothetical protein ILUMI_22811 [Ignelater luminosus]|uniref:Uncharacterized protein n=1 Tax=Ignelater luminosus TaxID=2038154 RepID=A0A8K0G295_IGNLU|nr:hypothetical protein ILUMI_22811 [Ignelater luminosus]
MAELNQKEQEDKPEEVQIRVISSNTYHISMSPNNKEEKNADDGEISDYESIKGHFGWYAIDEKTNSYIPYIIRNNEKYCAVRMVEKNIVSPYTGTVHQDVYCSCINVQGYYTTEAERRLLNEINSFHCDFEYGKLLFSQQDCIILLEDALEFYKFLSVCYLRLLKVKTPSDKCGFIVIDDKSVVPYVLYNDEKYLPLFYFEGAEHLQMNAKTLRGWHLAYMKFCFKIQGIRDEFLKQDSCAAVSINDVKECFPPNTVFKDIWPSTISTLNKKTTNHNRYATRTWVTLPSAQVSSTS